MRYHIFKPAPTSHLLIADSQAREIEFGNFNILSLPAGQIQHFYKFIPARDKYTLIVLFLGGNNLYKGTDDLEADIEEIANDLVELENKFTTVAKKVFVIGIPPRSENFARAKSLNDLLKQKTVVSWKFRCSNHYLKSKKSKNQRRSAFERKRNQQSKKFAQR